jgi:hypothetical protein
MTREEEEKRFLILTLISRDAGCTSAADSAAWIERQDQEELKLYINEVMINHDKPMPRFEKGRP